VAPSGQGAHEKKDQDDDQDDSHDFFSFPLSEIQDSGHRASCSIRERITVAYFTIRLFFTVVTPLTLLRFGPLYRRLVRINEAAQLNRALVRSTLIWNDLKKIIFRKQGFYLGRDDRIVNDSPVLSLVF